MLAAPSDIKPKRNSYIVFVILKAIFIVIIYLSISGITKSNVAIVATKSPIFPPTAI